MTKRRMDWHQIKIIAKEKENKKKMKNIPVIRHKIKIKRVYNRSPLLILIIMKRKRFRRDFIENRKKNYAYHKKTLSKRNS